jgi:hypothetical protein
VKRVLVDAIEDGVHVAEEELVNGAEDVADIVAGCHVVAVAGEEANLVSNAHEVVGHAVLELLRTRLARLVDQVLDDVIVDDLQGDAVPGCGQVVEVVCSPVWEHHAF